MPPVQIKMSATIPDHDSAAEYVQASFDLTTMPVSEVIQRIVKLNHELCKFWSQSSGWAPIEAAQLLNKSRLDWQVQLSRTLLIWSDTSDTQNTEGRLILAWVNLGSLLEGTLKLFLSVWHQSYVQDVEAIKKNGKLQLPDGLQLDALRTFFKKQIWSDDFDKIVLNIQTKRNAIHAFKNKDIGTWEEYSSAVKDYLVVLRYINFRLPYPDDIYTPREC
jgi:hypothetical protein